MNSTLRMRMLTTKEGIMKWQRVILVLGVFVAIIVSAALLEASLAAGIIGTITVLYRMVDHSLGGPAETTSSTSSTTSTSGTSGGGTPGGTSYIGLVILAMALCSGFALFLGMSGCGGSQESVTPDPEFSGSVEAQANEDVVLGVAEASVCIGPLEATLTATASLSSEAQLFDAYLEATYLKALSVHASIEWDVGCRVAEVCLGFSEFEHCFTAGESICVEPAAPAEGGG